LKQIRRHVTYANVMSSLAVFMILGGATAFAAVQKIGAKEIKANSIKTGKIVKEAVTAGKIKKAAVTEGKLADGAVTTNKLANDAVTGDKVNEATLGVVPNAAKLDGKAASSFASSAGGIKAAFVYDGGSIELAFNAINGGAFTVLTDGTESDLIQAPFSLEDRIAVVSGATINDTGGQSAPFPRCIYSVENVTSTTFEVHHVNADAAGACDEEWSILIF
jgi:hypothetical protein